MGYCHGSRWISPKMAPAWNVFTAHVETDKCRLVSGGVLKYFRSTLISDSWWLSVSRRQRFIFFSCLLPFVVILWQTQGTAPMALLVLNKLDFLLLLLNSVSKCRLYASSRKTRHIQHQLGVFFFFFFTIRFVLSLRYLFHPTGVTTGRWSMVHELSNKQSSVDRCVLQLWEMHPQGMEKKNKLISQLRIWARPMFVITPLYACFIHSWQDCSTF